MAQLKYNIRWIEQTFPSKAAAESLLKPEYDAGNLTIKDYEAATSFLPGFHRQYRYAGAIISLPVFFALRRPHWSNIRSYVLLTATSFTGYLIGHFASLTAHYNFVRSIESPENFSRALDNIQKNSGLSPPVPGPTIVRQWGNWKTDHDPELPPINTTPAQDQTAPMSTTDASPASIKPLSKWDQIRAANSRMSTSSSWDAIRQNQERERVSPSATSTASTPNTSEKPRTDDRAAEQAKFDEMLEKERNLK